MLIPYLRSKFVTKILTSPSGEIFRVVFLVALVDGEIKAQVVFAKSLNNESVNSSILKLGEIHEKDEISYLYIPSYYTFVVSPFNSFFFYNSQPTRAPVF